MENGLQERVIILYRNNFGRYSPLPNAQERSHRESGRPVQCVSRLLGLVHQSYHLSLCNNTGQLAVTRRQVSEQSLPSRNSLPQIRFECRIEGKFDGRVG